MYLFFFFDITKNLRNYKLLNECSWLLQILAMSWASWTPVRETFITWHHSNCCATNLISWIVNLTTRSGIVSKVKKRTRFTESIWMAMLLNGCRWAHSKARRQARASSMRADDPWEITPWPLPCKVGGCWITQAAHPIFVLFAQAPSVCILSWAWPILWRPILATIKPGG